jgi:hypothetical protein
MGAKHRAPTGKKIFLPTYFFGLQGRGDRSLARTWAYCGIIKNGAMPKIAPQP